MEAMSTKSAEFNKAFDYESVKGVMTEENGVNATEANDIQQLSDEVETLKMELAADGSISAEDAEQLHAAAEELVDKVKSSVDESALSNTEKMALTEFCGECFDKLSGETTDLFSGSSASENAAPAKPMQMQM